MEYYWKKKTVVSFILAVLVSMIHLEISKNYIQIDLASSRGGYN